MLNITSSISWQYGDYIPGSDPNAALTVSLELLQKQVMDFTETFERVADEVLEPAVLEQIESEGRFMGMPWTPLAPLTTVKDRERRGYGGEHPMLVREGDLRDSFTSGGGDHVQTISPQAMDWGSALPKSLFLHTGTREGYRFGRSSLGLLGIGLARVQGARNVGMPGRPIIEVTDEIGGSIVDQFMQTMVAAANEAGIENDGGEKAGS